MNKSESGEKENSHALKMIVSLLSKPGDLTQEDITDPCIWQLARANQLLLAVGRAVVEQFGESTIPAEFLSIYKRLEQLSKNTLIIMAELLPIFNERNLPILTIKSFLPFSFVDSNVDIVTVEPDRTGQYVKQLLHLDYRHQFNLADLREPDKKAYGKPSWKQMDEEFPKVHLHQAISWNGVDYLNLDAVSARSQTWCCGDVSIPIPAPHDELLIMAAHAFFENKYITLHELLYLTYLTQQITDWTGLFSSASQYHWEPAFRKFLSIAATLANAIGLSIIIPESIQLISHLSIRLPYLLPARQSFAYSWQKFSQDLKARQWRQIPRQLFTYSFVDSVWMYRKAWRKQRKVQSC